MIHLSITRPVAVTMAYGCAAILGIFAWRNIPIELLPDTSLPQLTVTASWRGASPEATEASLTSPLEAVIQQIRGVDRISSISSDDNGSGSAEISVEFARSTDMQFARLELSERLAALETELPAGVQGPFIQAYVPQAFRKQTMSFLVYTITGPYTPEALRTYVDDVIGPALQQVDGVAQITARGGRARALEVELDERKVASLGLRTDVVSRRIAELEMVVQAGTVLHDGVERSVAIREHAASAADVRGAVLLSDRGRIVRVSDVATVHDGYEDPRDFYRIDGQPAVSFEVHKSQGTNSVAAADRVKARLATVVSTLPAGARLILDRDESKEIRAQLTDLRSRSALSAAIIVAVLLVFLRSVRATAIVFATIAFSILIAVNLLYFAGLTLNVLTLMGLAMGFGLIADNAIVVVENIYRLRSAGDAPERAAERGASEVGAAVVAATLTNLVVFIPFLYLQGELRVYYVPFAIAVSVSMLASLAVSFSFVPALAGRLLGRRAARPRLSRGIAARLYGALLELTLRHPWPTVALSLALLGASWRVFDKYVERGRVWQPSESTAVVLAVRLPQGDELERTDEITRHFERQLAAMPGVERFVSTVQPLNAQIRVTFPGSLQLGSTPFIVKEQLTQEATRFGGVDIAVYGYGPGFSSGGTGGGSPSYSIKILGYNYEKVRAIAEDIGLKLAQFSRIKGVDVNSSGNLSGDDASEVVLRVDRERAAMHGLTARDVVSAVGDAVRGAPSGRLRVGGEQLAFAVKLAGHQDMDVFGLQELLVLTSAGGGVRLGDVATVQERRVLGRILRENQQYQRTVSYEFRGPPKLGDRVRAAVVASTRVPEGYQVIGDPSDRWSNEEEQQFVLVLAVAVLLVFMTVAALFESLRQPFCVLLTVPMALIGVFLIFFYSGATFTREAYVGVIMMSGIVVNNAILLINRVNQLRRRDGMALRDAIVEGTLQRLRPILMTSVSTTLGFLPLVVLGESANANIWNALGYALIGGLSSSTILVLVVTPATYWLLERGRGSDVQA